MLFLDFCSIKCCNLRVCLGIFKTKNLGFFELKGQAMVILFFVAIFFCILEDTCFV